MRTYPICDAAGRVSAFEVENAYVGPRRLARLLRSIAGVTAVRVSRRPPFLTDLRVTFLFEGRACIVWEPYGDSSRYWIGPDDDGAGPSDVARLQVAIRGYRVPWLRQVLGDLVSFRIPFWRPA